MKRIEIIGLCVAVAIWSFLGGVIAGGIQYKNKISILEEKQSYIALKYQNLDNEMVVINEVIEILEKYNLDIKEILMIRDREVKNRIRFGGIGR